MMAKDPEEQESRIKVTDRRIFTPDGERRVPDAPPEERPDREPHGETVRGQGFEMHPPTEGESPAVDFSSFIVSLASAASIHLGQVEDPAVGQEQVNPEAARELIDILDMLRSKTAGNLDPREQRILNGILAELKMAYASKVSGRS